MLWIGLIVGFVIGGSAGALLMAMFAGADARRSPRLPNGERQC